MGRFWKGHKRVLVAALRLCLSGSTKHWIIQEEKTPYLFMTRVWKWRYEISLFFYLRISPQGICIKMQNQWKTQFNHSHLGFSFSFREKASKSTKIKSKPHINSKEGLQACPACRKMHLSFVGLTLSTIQLNSYPSSCIPTAEFPVNRQGKSKHLCCTTMSIYFIPILQSK